MPPNSTLPLVLAHANAGALAEARRLLRAAGLDEVRDDPAVLAIRGRLLKEEARAALPAVRAPLYAQAAEAYAAAGTLSGATHHLINAASLWRLAGDRLASEAMARRVLASLDDNPGEPETPYWRGATRAEALLLTGRPGEARRALAEAVSVAPRAYEDHAPTLRQFRLLCTALGERTDWLDAFTPPRSLHFAGHMGVRADDAAVRTAVRALVAAERIGFGFGALAAGADIVVAEELLEAGVEVDLVLPCDPERFRAVSVAGQGADWARRFDAVLAGGVVAKIVGDGASPTPAALQLAAEAAMGLAILRAQALQTEALQLVLLDPAGGQGAGEPGGADWASTRWSAGGRRQVVIPAAREGGPPPEAPSDPSHRLAALLTIEVDPESLEGVVQALADALSPLAPSVWMEGSLRLAFADPMAAANAAHRLRAVIADGARMAAHYGVVTSVEAPGLGGPILAGSALDLPRAILAGAPPGAWHVSETFAAGLAAVGAGDHPIIVGELSGQPILAL